MPRRSVELVELGVGYTGLAGRGTAGMTVCRTLRPLKISHNVEEHAKGVYMVQVTHSPKRVLGEAEYVVRHLVISTEVNLDMLAHCRTAQTMRLSLPKP
jgi:hypothetical protein